MANKLTGVLAVVPQPVYSNMEELCGGFNTGSSMSIAGEASEAEESSTSTIGSAVSVLQANVPQESAVVSEGKTWTHHCTVFGLLLLSVSA